jgi:chorismate mutase
MTISLKPVRAAHHFELTHIAAILEGLEETIIFKLIDRAQFAHNAVVYETNQSGFEGAEGRSLFELRLLKHETMDAEFGRFHVPEERPFMSPLPAVKRRVNLPVNGLKVADFNAVNVTDRVLKAYRKILPNICLPGDDGQYGSSVEHDVAALQAISRRIHFGAFYVAESKCQSDPKKYRELARKGDRQGLMASLTRADVEERILDRVAEKVARIQADINSEVRRRIPPEAIMGFYRESVIPLTKEGEIRYFLNRKFGEA